ncbi:hypothetical protein [Roseibium sp.]|uniref:hypothetical protein n=1 Tax=Roseibium sp. TaxID=1936156 RepID=UPI003267AF1D
MTTRDFPARGYEQRPDLAQRARRKRHPGALLFTTEAGLRYFSSFRTQFNK